MEVLIISNLKVIRPKGGEKYKCTFCNSSFSRASNCKRHMQYCKNNNDREIIKFSCPQCLATFNRLESFKAHSVKCQMHDANSDPPNDAVKPKMRNPCFVKDCPENFFHKIRLIEHIKESHSDIEIKEPVKLSFKGSDEFFTWKEKEEEKTFSYFSLRNGKKNSKYIHYYCQRDERMRNSCEKKTSRCQNKGRVGLGHPCIARIRVETGPDGPLEVTYHPTHSHPCDPQDIVHHPLPRKLSEFIDKQISENVTPSEILTKLNNLPTANDTEGLQTSKINIVTRKRIAERARKYQMNRRIYETASPLPDFHYLVPNESVLEIQQQQKDEENNDTLCVGNTKYASLITNIETNLATLKRFQETAKENNCCEKTLKHVNIVLRKLVCHIKQADNPRKRKVFSHKETGTSQNQPLQIPSCKKSVAKRKRMPKTICREEIISAVENPSGFPSSES